MPQETFEWNKKSCIFLLSLWYLQIMQSTYTHALFSYLCLNISLNRAGYHSVCLRIPLLSYFPSAGKSAPTIFLLVGRQYIKTALPKVRGYLVVNEPLYNLLKISCDIEYLSFKECNK